MLTTSLHLEIARLRRENERLREQRDALLKQNAESCVTTGNLGIPQTMVPGFMDKHDWDQLGVAVEGARVFPSIAALKKHTEDTERGIVEVEMRLVRVVEPATTS
jgi:hypothetical protein